MRSEDPDNWPDDLEEFLGALDRPDPETEELHFRTCGQCGQRTTPRRSASACLEEARRYGWRRVALSDRPGAARMDLCGTCADESGLGPPVARFGW